MKLQAIISVLVFVFSAQANAQSPDFQETLEKAEACDAQAQLKLGFRYRDGEGVGQNDKEATRWFRLAAEQGNALAQNLLGLQYLVGGRGVVQNYKEALNWFSLAAKQGHSGSQSEIATMYEQGRGIARNLSLSYIWYSLATTTEIRGSESPLVSGTAIARDRVAAKLSPQALQQAQSLAVKCFESNYQDCGE